MTIGSDKIVNLKAEVGATLRHRLIVSDENGDPIDFSSSTAKLQVRDEVGGTVIVELTEAATPVGSLTLSALGEIDIRVEATESWTSSPPLTAPARWVYDLLVTTAGDTDRLVEGVVDVVPGITSPSP